MWYIKQDYRKRRHVIATQLPMANTITDFWTMIEFQRVKIIVQLEKQVELLNIVHNNNTTNSNWVLSLIPYKHWHSSAVMGSCLPIIIVTLVNLGSFSWLGSLPIDLLFMSTQHPNLAKNYVYSPWIINLSWGQFFNHLAYCYIPHMCVCWSLD